MHCDDSDMKIAPDDPSELFDQSEGAANAFVRETNNGNMEKARQLGLSFAAEITAKNKGVTLFGIGAFDDDRTRAQRRVLFGFTVDQVIEGMAPNSIVAQSALSAFHDAIRAQSPADYDILCDAASLSVYILAGRSLETDLTALGKAFASLCGKENDHLFIEYGTELYNYFTMYCTQLVLKAQLVR